MAKVKHVALLKFKEGTPDEQIQVAFERLLDLSEAVTGVEDYVAGENCSPEGLARGFTHAFVMTFSDLAARDAYIAHPSHREVREIILPLVEAEAVVDFEV